MRKPSILDWLLLIVLVVTWGASFVAIKIAILDIGPAWLAAFRLLIATILMMIFARSSNVRLPRGKKEWLIAAVLGVIGTTLPFTLIGWASYYVPSGIAGLMMATNPMLVLILAIVFLPEERPNRARVAGLLIGFFGVALVIAGRSGGLEFDQGKNANLLFGLDATLLAFIALLAGALGYAINNVVSRRAADMPHATRGYGALITATPAAILIAAISEPLPGVVSISSLGATFYLAIFPTWIATLILYRLIDKTSSAFVAQSNYLVPATAILLGAIILGESLGTMQYAGFITILVGISIAEGVFLRPKAYTSGADH